MSTWTFAPIRSAAQTERDRKLADYRAKAQAAAKRDPTPGGTWMDRIKDPALNFQALPQEIADYLGFPGETVYVKDGDWTNPQAEAYRVNPANPFGASAFTLEELEYRAAVVQAIKDEYEKGAEGGSEATRAALMGEKGASSGPTGGAETSVAVLFLGALALLFALARRS